MFCGLAGLREIVNKENRLFGQGVRSMLVGEIVGKNIILHAAEDFFFGLGTMHDLREEDLFEVAADVIELIDISPMQVVAVGQ